MRRQPTLSTATPHDRDDDADQGYHDALSVDAPNAMAEVGLMEGGPEQGGDPVQSLLNALFADFDKVVSDYLASAWSGINSEESKLAARAMRDEITRTKPLKQSKADTLPLMKNSVVTLLRQASLLVGKKSATRTRESRFRDAVHPLWMRGLYLVARHEDLMRLFFWQDVAPQELERKGQNPFIADQLRQELLQSVVETSDVARGIPAHTVGDLLLSMAAHVHHIPNVKLLAEKRLVNPRALRFYDAQRTTPGGVHQKTSVFNRIEMTAHDPWPETIKLLDGGPFSKGVMDAWATAMQRSPAHGPEASPARQEMRNYLESLPAIITDEHIEASEAEVAVALREMVVEACRHPDSKQKRLNEFSDGIRDIRKAANLEKVLFYRHGEAITTLHGAPVEFIDNVLSDALARLRAAREDSNQTEEAFVYKNLLGRLLKEQLFNKDVALSPEERTAILKICETYQASNPALTALLLKHAVAYKDTDPQHMYDLVDGMVQVLRPLNQRAQNNYFGAIATLLFEEDNLALDTAFCGCLLHALIVMGEPEGALNTPDFGLAKGLLSKMLLPKINATPRGRQEAAAKRAELMRSIRPAGSFTPLDGLSQAIQLQSLELAETFFLLDGALSAVTVNRDLGQAPWVLAIQTLSATRDTTAHRPAVDFVVSLLKAVRIQRAHALRNFYKPCFPKDQVDAAIAALNDLGGREEYSRLWSQVLEENPYALIHYQVLPSVKALFVEHEKAALIIAQDDMHEDVMSPLVYAVQQVGRAQGEGPCSGAIAIVEALFDGIALQQDEEPALPIPGNQRRSISDALEDYIKVQGVSAFTDEQVERLGALQHRLTCMLVKYSADDQGSVTSSSGDENDLDEGFSGHGFVSAGGRPSAFFARRSRAADGGSNSLSSSCASEDAGANLLPGYGNGGDY